MEEWYSMLRTMQDNAENPFLVTNIAKRIFHDLSSMRIKEKVKFKNRMGAEFIRWAHKLESEYDPDLVGQILTDNDFWELSLRLTR